MSTHDACYANLVGSILKVNFKDGSVQSYRIVEISGKSIQS